MIRKRMILAAFVALTLGATSSTIVSVGEAGASPTSRQSATPPPPCTGTIQIVKMAFKPSPVFPAQQTAVHLVARNCTAQSQQTTVTWYGRFETLNHTFAGCPVIDPLAQGAKFAPFATFDGKVGYLVPGDCTATSLAVTVKISQGGSVLAKRTAKVLILRPV